MLIKSGVTIEPGFVHHFHLFLVLCQGFVYSFTLWGWQMWMYSALKIFVCLPVAKQFA